MKSPAIHRTPLYRAKAAYRNMIARCGNNNGKNPAYANVELRMSMDDWLSWSIPRYEAFLTDHPDISPNVSRMGDTGHYELNNLEITTSKSNRFLMKVPDKGSQELICPTCDKEFTRTNRYIKGKVGEGVLNLFCSQSCRSLNLRA